jgi:hypothetical protein
VVTLSGQRLSHVSGVVVSDEGKMDDDLNPKRSTYSLLHQILIETQKKEFMNRKFSKSKSAIGKASCVLHHDPQGIKIGYFFNDMIPVSASWNWEVET